MNWSRTTCGKIALHNQVDDQEFQPVVVERALELRDDQAPETQPPVRRSWVRASGGAYPMGLSAAAVEASLGKVDM